MATLIDLHNAIDALLAHPAGPGSYQLVQPVEEKAYEAYVFGLCLRAVRELGVQPLLRGISAIPDPFVFRGAPGQIHSRHRNYGYASFTLNRQEFEIHAGVEFVGTSGMNIGVLSTALDLNLVNVDREQAAGSFSIDLLAEDEGGGTVTTKDMDRREKALRPHLKPFKLNA